MSTVAGSYIQNNPTALVVPESDLKAILELDSFCKSSQSLIQSAHDSGNELHKALVLARAMKGISQRLTPAIMSDIMTLQSSALGFKTDLDRDGGYKLDTVRSVAVQALIQGLRMTGNEVNIIAGNCYATVKGLQRLVGEFDGLTDLVIDMGVPVQSGPETCLVPCKAKWKYQGRDHVLECLKTEEMDSRIPVRVSAKFSTTPDAISGKAKRKLYARIYERLTGSKISLAEDVDDQGVAASATPTSVSQSSIDPTVDGEEFDAEFEIVKEPLPESFMKDLQVAIEQAKTPAQLENTKVFWIQKAQNRNFSVGQLASIEGMFEG